MIPDPETFDLPELCERADVTPRTVRYYVQQGLLPSPGARGPGARYDRGHLDRLRLIKLLQREHLPLAEIRHQLSVLHDDAVAAALRDAPATPQKGSALSYVREVLTSGRARQPASPPRTVRSPVMSEDASMLLAEPALRVTRSIESHRGAAGPAASVVTAGGDRSTWERVALAPDVELHVRRPLSRAQNKLVDSLIAHARTLFTEEP